MVRQELEAEKGIRIGLRTLEREVAPFRAQLEAEARATVRFETPPGKQLQIDFGERRVCIGGETMKVFLFVATLGYSRRIHVRAFRNERQESWFEAFYYASTVARARQPMVHEAAYLVDHDSHLLYVNDEAIRALGYSREELFRMCVADIDTEFPEARWPSYWSEVKKEGVLTFETRHKTKDGRVFPVEITSNYFEYGGRAYTMGLARDITERKSREEKIGLLLQEVNHRSKNMLTVVQAIARGFSSSL